MRSSYFAARCKVLITGASVGIGCEFARQLAPVVSTMILVARSNDRLEALESELKAINPELELFSRPLEIGDRPELERFCDWLEESGPTINLLINNAGLGDHGPFVNSKWERVDSMLECERERADLPHIQSAASDEKGRVWCDPECEFHRQPASFAEQCGVCRDESVRDQF